MSHALSLDASRADAIMANLPPDGGGGPGPDRPLAREARRALASLEALADRPPCVVLLGERNSGKSTAANALIGAGLLPTNIVVSTRHPTLIRYAPRPSLHAILADGRRVAIADDADLASLTPALLDVGLPVTRLKSFEVLDTPAGFAPDRLAALPGLSAQLITVWCTLATQAWKANEQANWLALDARLRRNGVLAVTAIDRIAVADDRQRLALRLEQTAGRHFSAIAASSREPRAQAMADTMGNTVMTDGAAAAGPLDEALAEALERIAGPLHLRRKRTIARLCSRLTRLAGLDGVQERATDDARSPDQANEIDDTRCVDDEPLPAFLTREAFDDATLPTIGAIARASEVADARIGL